MDECLIIIVVVGEWLILDNLFSSTQMTSRLFRLFCVIINYQFLHPNMIEKSKVPSVLRLGEKKSNLPSVQSIICHPFGTF